MKLINSFILLLLIPCFCSAKDYLCTTKHRNILRESPSFNSKRLKILKKYTPLEKISYSKNWYKVKGIDYKGYIYKTIVSDKMKCMMLLNTSHSYCIGKTKRLSRVLFRRETFKIIKQELGCNYVKEKWGSRIWLSSGQIWPKEYAKRIKILPSNDD